MPQYTLAFCAIISLSTALTRPAGANENGLEIGGNVIFRFGYNGIYDAQSPLSESNDAFGIMIASPEFRFGKRFSILSEIRFEAVRPPAEDRFFEDEGLFVRKLYGNYRVNDDFSLYFGKWTPSFTLASLVTPGMYGNNYNKEIELIERVGFGADYTLNAGDAGSHKLSVSTFFDDTSFLSDSWGSSRGPKKLTDGGASNTESLDSFALSLEGSDISALPGFTYKLGLLHQARGVDGVADENGVLLAAMQSRDLGYEKSLTWIGEVAPIWSFGGTKDDIVYASAGLVYESGRWTSVLSGTYRRRDLANGDTYNDYSVQTSLDYDLGSGLSLAFAHEFLSDQNDRSQRFGIRFSKTFNLDR